MDNLLKRDIGLAYMAQRGEVSLDRLEPQAMALYYKCKREELEEYLHKLSNNEELEIDKNKLSLMGEEESKEPEKEEKEEKEEVSHNEDIKLKDIEEALSGLDKRTMAYKKLKTQYDNLV